MQDPPSVDILRDVEDRLRERLPRVGVLEEVGLSWQDWDEIGRAMQVAFRQGREAGLRAIRRHPYSLAAFLALTGTYRYNSDGLDGYWAGVEAALGDVRLPHAELGSTFERIVKVAGLTTFPRVTGYRFVSLILLHGGIPNACLGNYFTHVVEPLFRSGIVRYLEGRAIIDEIHASTHWEYLLKPTRYYLEYGGEIAADFVGRTLDLHERTLEGLIRTETAEYRQEAAAITGLPERVVLGYHEWCHAEGASRAVAHTAGYRHAWVPPTIRFDTIEALPVLELPAQILPAGLQEGVWTVRCADTATTFAAEGWHHGASVRTRATVFSVPKPCALYHVSWRCGSYESSWKFVGLDEHVPLMAFYASDGSAIDVREGLPRTPIWVMRPDGGAPGGHGLDFSSGGAQLVDRAEPAHPGWNGYVSECWDLSGCPVSTTELEIQREPSRSVWLMPAGDLRVRLDATPYVGVTCGGTPVYDHVPDLVIPLARTKEMLEQWTVTWRSQHAEGTLDLEAIAIARSGSWCVPLANLSTFTPVRLSVRGPLGRSARLELSLWPGLRVEGIDALHLPDEEGMPRTVTMRLVPPVGGRFTGTTVPFDVESSTVEVPPEVVAFSAALEHEGVRTGELVIEVPRLRWQLYDAATEGPASGLASAYALRIPGRWVEQVSLPRLAVFGTGAARDALRVFAQYRGQQIECQRLGRGTAAYDVAALTSALRNAGMGHARLYGQLNGRSFVVGTWHAELGFEGLRATSHLVEDGVRVGLSWDAGRWVEGASVRLWPQWTPWKMSVEASAISLGTQGCQALFTALDPGEYLAEVVVVDQWAMDIPKRPVLGRAETTPVVVGTDAERYHFCAGLPGVRGHLVRYCAAATPAQRQVSWAGVCEEIVPDDLPDVLEVIVTLRGGDYEASLARALDDRVFDRLEEAFEGREEDLLAAVGRHPHPEHQPALALLLGLLDGPAPWTVQQGLRIWAPLGAAALRGPLAAADVADLAWPPEQGLTFEALQDRCHFGLPVQEAHAATTPAQLEMLRSFIGLVPSGPLGTTGCQMGYLDWHRNRLTRASPSNRLVSRSFLATLDRHLEALLGCHRVSEPLVRAVRGRLNHRARGEDAPGWLNVPYVVGAIALVLRATASAAPFEPYMAPYRHELHRFALTALTAAPQLLAHDLCWFSTAYTLLADADPATA